MRALFTPRLHSRSSVAARLLSAATAAFVCVATSCAPLRGLAADANRLQCQLRPSPVERRVIPEVPGIESACSAGTIVYIVPAESGPKGGVVLVDAGFDESGAPIKEALRGRRVLAILLTHGHLDHRAAAHQFDAPVYVGRGDVALMAGERTSKAPIAVLGDVVGVPPLPKVLIPVDDGFTLVVGDKTFRAVALPGHTPGSTGWLLGRVMFSGDAVQGPLADNIYPAPPYVSDDIHLAYESLRKLELLDVDTILDAHFGRLDHVKRFLPAALARSHDELQIGEQPVVRPQGCREGDVVPPH